MILEPIFADGLAHLSYLLGCDGAGCAAVIDPRRDVDIYLDLAQRAGVRITHIFETHIHADYVSGSVELAARTGAQVCVGAADGYGFPHRALRDGDTIPLGSIRLTARHTPGHTPEHVCYVAASASAPDRPWAVFTGDALFVGEVGRPDLLGESLSRQLARQLYSSLQDVLLALPDDVIIYPSHGAGSPCGGSIGDRRSSTIGYERHNNPRLQIEGVDAFEANVMANVPPAPIYYPRMKRINAEGPRLLGSLPAVPILSPEEFHREMREQDTLVIDTRSLLGFCGGHIPGALSIELREEFPIWAGWMVDPDKRILLVLRDPSHLDKAVRHLVRIGCDRIDGYLRDMRSYQESGLPLVPLLSLFVQDLRDQLGRDGLQLVDVRPPLEFARGHIPGARNIFVPEIEARAGELDPERTVAVYCGSGFRSSIAASVLQRLGFKDVRNVPGSMLAWRNAGFPVEA